MLRRLKPDQAPETRRRNRRKVFGAVRAIMIAVDSEFPTDRRPTRKLSSAPEARRARWERAGWVRLHGTRFTWGFLAPLKVPMRNAQAGLPTADWYVPGW